MILLYAWFSMLFIGAAHSHDAAVPALGYVAVLLLGIAARLVLNGLPTTALKTSSKPTVVNQTIFNGKATA